MLQLLVHVVEAGVQLRLHGRHFHKDELHQILAVAAAVDRALRRLISSNCWRFLRAAGWCGAGFGSRSAGNLESGQVNWLRLVARSGVEEGRALALLRGGDVYKRRPLGEVDSAADVRWRQLLNANNRKLQLVNGLLTRSGHG